MPKHKPKATSEGKGVNKMSRLPGFTAAASLYGTSERYAGAGIVETVDNRAVIPQICYTIPVCLPVIHKRIRVCLSLFGGFSWSYVNC